MTEVFEDYVLLLYMTKGCYDFYIFYYNINIYVIYVCISIYTYTAKYILIPIHILDNILDMKQHRMKMGDKVNSS